MPDRITGVVFIAISVILINTLKTAPYEGRVFPLILLYTLIGLSLLLIIRKKQSKGTPFEKIREALVGAAFIVVYTILLPLIGFIPATFIFLAGAIYATGYRASKLRIAVLSVLITFITYGVFGVLLRISLP